MQELGNPHLNPNWLDRDSRALRSSKETACALTPTFGIQTRGEKSSGEMAIKMIFCFALCVLFHVIDVESRPRKLSYGPLFVDLRHHFNIIKVFFGSKSKNLVRLGFFDDQAIAL